MSEHQNSQWVLWLYDQIMGQIEPDLLSDQIPLLEEKYKTETAEERKNRTDAYAKAFHIFDEVFKEMASGIYAEVEQLKHLAQKDRAFDEQSQHQGELQSLEQQLDFPTDA